MLLESEVMGFYFPVCSALQTSPKHSFVSIMDPAIYLIRSTASQQGLDCIACMPTYESHAYQNDNWKRITLDLFLFTHQQPHIYSHIYITVLPILICIQPVTSYLILLNCPNWLLHYSVGYLILKSPLLFIILSKQHIKSRVLVLRCLKTTFEQKGYRLKLTI